MNIPNQRIRGKSTLLRRCAGAIAATPLVYVALVILSDGASDILTLLSILVVCCGTALDVLGYIQLGARAPVGVRSKSWTALLAMGLAIVLIGHKGVTMRNWARETENHAICLGNMKQISFGLMMYAEDYDGCLPPSGKWNEAFVSEWARTATAHRGKPAAKVLFCPSADDANVPSCGMNCKLDGFNIKALEEAEKIVMVFESVPGRNRSGGPELLPSPARHNGGHNIGFADGHVKTIRAAGVKRLRWDPQRTSQREPRRGGR